jgi:hypothetical protein
LADTAKNKNKNIKVKSIKKAKANFLILAHTSLLFFTGGTHGRIGENDSKRPSCGIRTGTRTFSKSTFPHYTARVINANVTDPTTPPEPLTPT